MKLPLVLMATFLAGPALAQEGGRYIDPAPVNFERPFLYDGVRAREAAPLKSEPIPIEEWLANGRRVEGLRERNDPPALPLDARTLQELFREELPQLKMPAEEWPGDR